MIDHRKLPIKYCETCDTHFRALPGTHESVYHADEEWSYVDGSWRKAERRERFRVEGELE